MPDAGLQMNSLYALAAVVFAMAALACASLGVAICRRAERNSEIAVLVAMIATLALHLFALGADYWLYFSTHIIDNRVHYLLGGASDGLRVIFFMLGGHFLALSYARLVYYPGGAWTSDEPVFLALTQKQLGFWVMVLVTYGVGLVSLVRSVGSMAHTWQTHQDWQASPALPPESSLWGFFMGFSAGIWMVVQIHILAAIYHQLPRNQDRWSLADLFFNDRMAGGMDWIQLSLSNPAPQVEVKPTNVGRTEWKAFLTLMAGSIAAVGLQAFENTARKLGPAYAACWLMAAQLLPLVVVFPLVYYKTRFLFFDVLIKRGLLAVALVASIGVYFAALLVPLERSFPSGYPVILWAGAAVFVVFWTYVYRRLDRGLDRLIFRRPDYGKLVVEIGDGMRRFVEAQPLLDHVAAVLREALGAEFVRFSETAPGDQDAAASIAVSTARITSSAGCFSETARKGSSIGARTFVF